MDCTCSFQQPSVICGSEGTSYSLLESVNLRSSFKSIFVGNKRVALRGRSEKLKKLNFCSRSEVVSYLDCHNLPRSLGFSFGYGIKTSKGVVKTRCQGEDSVAFIDGNGNGRSVDYGESANEGSPTDEVDDSSGDDVVEEVEKGEGTEIPSLEGLRGLLQKARKELEIAQLNSTMFEEKAERISEAAIALKDEADNAWKDVKSMLAAIQEIVNKEGSAKEVVQTATMSLSLAVARLQVAEESLEISRKTSYKDKSTKGAEYNIVEDKSNKLTEEEETFLSAQEDIKECRATLANCEMELRQLQSKKQELQKEVGRLVLVAEKAERDASKAEEDVSNIMLLAEKAVAFELEAAKQVNDAEIVLQRAEKTLSASPATFSKSTVLQNEPSQMSEGALVEEDKKSRESSGGNNVDRDKKVSQDSSSTGDVSLDSQLDVQGQRLEESRESEDGVFENGKLSTSQKDIDEEAQKSNNVVQDKKSESHKDSNRDSSPFSAPKALLNKSSRFFAASFFSFAGDGTEFTPASVFYGLIKSGRKQLPKLVVGLLLAGSGYAS